MNHSKRQPYEDSSIIKANKFQVYKQKMITGYKISNKTRINIGLYLLFRDGGNNSETSKDLNRPSNSIQWLRYWAVDIIIITICLFFFFLCFVFDKMVTFNYAYTGKP